MNNIKLDYFDIGYVLFYGILNSIWLGLMSQYVFNYQAFTNKDYFIMFVIFILSTKLKVSEIKFEYLQQKIENI